jgi:phospho-N-acetylmuramoyl-pentapeptide-transferase
MLFYLQFLKGFWSPLNLFRYVTFRAVAAAGTAFLLSVLIGPPFIRFLRRLNFRQHLREEISVMHESKAGTPTMGGLLILSALLLATVLWADLGNRPILLVLATLVYLGGIGFCDDFIKIRRGRNLGLRAWHKLALQAVGAAALVFALRSLPAGEGRLDDILVPFLKRPLVEDAGLVFCFIWVVLVVVGASNAVNLTDGLDGLAIGCSASVALSYVAFSYVAGHIAFAQHLLVPYVRGAAELTVFCGAMAGACLGFLWFNCHPAQVFMGDTGSLALGGSIALVALLVKQEIALVLVGGVFVAEALSVILQVASFKLTGRRLFAMAPLHHHFEKRKWSETQVTIRFWILSILCALLGLITLKIR